MYRRKIKCVFLLKKYIQTTGRKDFNRDVWVVDLFLCLVRFARVYLENTSIQQHIFPDLEKWYLALSWPDYYNTMQQPKESFKEQQHLDRSSPQVCSALCSGTCVADPWCPLVSPCDLCALEIVHQVIAWQTARTGVKLRGGDVEV